MCGCFSASFCKDRINALRTERAAAFSARTQKERRNNGEQTELYLRNLERSRV